MNQTDIPAAAKRAAEKSKNLLAQQVDRQATALGASLSQTARDLEAIGQQLSQSGTIASAADLADRAAGYVDRAGRYLQNGNTDRFIEDVETFSRERPWAVAASAAALGFVAARIVKSSSARRFAETYSTGAGAAATSNGSLDAGGSAPAYRPGDI
jgi:ElaB/YqjD/DUF883 family membrane-anchored ribosome-binding protein